MLGARHATAPVLTYLDSHCECTTGKFIINFGEQCIFHWRIYFLPSSYLPSFLCFTRNFSQEIYSPRRSAFCKLLCGWWIIKIQFWRNISWIVVNICLLLITFDSGQIFLFQNLIYIVSSKTNLIFLEFDILVWRKFGWYVKVIFNAIRSLFAQWFIVLLCTIRIKSLKVSLMADKLKKNPSSWAFIQKQFKSHRV